MSRHRTGRRALAATMSGAVLLAGCGVGTDASPRVIPAEEVKYQLLDPTGTTTSTAPAATTVEETVYLLDQRGKLQPVQREVEAPATLTSRLESLLGPVSESELDRELRTAIPPGTELLGPATVDSDGIVRLNLSEELYDVLGETFRQALAQIVWTIDREDDEIQGVQISVDGTVREVQDDKGANKREVARNDYRGYFSLRPPAN